MPNKPIDTKVIQDAIKERYPMYWELHSCFWQLRATTYTWENGAERSKKLFEIQVMTVADMQTIRSLHLVLLKHYRLQIDSLDVMNQLWSKFLDNYRLVDNEFKVRRLTPPDGNEQVLKLFEVPA
jgi:hypothetical protein